jgi:hypothetical protein
MTNFRGFNYVVRFNYIMQCLDYSIRTITCLQCELFWTWVWGNITLIASRSSILIMNLIHQWDVRVRCDYRGRWCWSSIRSRRYPDYWNRVIGIRVHLGSTLWYCRWNTYIFKNQFKLCYSRVPLIAHDGHPI